ncbi:MAG: hypothetical protein WA982_02135 [Rubrobacteraceae bacterium]
MGDTSPKINERRMFAEWMLIFVSFPVGGIMALAFVGPMDDVFSAALGGVMAGVVIGAAQLVVLRRHIGMTVGWLVSTAIGLALGNSIGVLLNNAGTLTTDLLILGVVAGLAVGIVQFALLQEYVQRAILWPPTVALAWPLGWLVTSFTGTNIELGYTVFESFGGVAFAALTGVALMSIARATNERAQRKADAVSET